MTKPIMTLKDLSCARGSRVVLEDVNLSISDCEAVVLRGPNGAGKTTLLRTIAGLQPPHAGHVVCDMDDVAYASHADGLKAAMTASENLSFWASLYGGGQVDAALDALNLSDLAHRTAQSLSAGQKRRLGLARLLVTGCKLWIMDEPTVSLDTATTDLFSRIVAKHVDQGGAAIASTHIEFMPGTRQIDVSEFAPKASQMTDFDEAFL